MAPLPYPALHASHAGVWLTGSQGKPRAVSRGEALAALAEQPTILFNAPLVAARLDAADLSGLDLLELFAFVHPARFLVPTAKGLSDTLGLERPANEASLPVFYRAAAACLLARMSTADWAEREGAWTTAQGLARLRWPWAAAVAQHLRAPEQAERWLFSRLPEWEETAPRPQPRTITLDEVATLDRLARLTGADAERRPGQRRYAVAAAAIFGPRPAEDRPTMLLAEAGTGTGKTLGYLAPGSLWAERAEGTLWVSTFTKALQRQLLGETRRIWPDPAEAARRVVVRKGRENYLCLLNLEDALQGGFGGRAALYAQLVARWAGYSADGDMVGGDLPGWLSTLFPRNGQAALTDRRGECIYAGCPHYRRCFIERSARASASADIVIANHALLMVNAARGRDLAARPTRIIFDEGHQLFGAADSMFGASFSGQETIELRRWLIGPEGTSKGRRRGLAARLADIASYDSEAATAIEAARAAALALPGDGWLQRLQEDAPYGPAERLLSAVRALVLARDASDAGAHGYGLEADYDASDDALIAAAAAAAAAIAAIRQPLLALAQRLEAVLTVPPDWLDAPGRMRIEGALAGLSWRVDTLAGWAALLARAGGPAEPDHVDWLAVQRHEGREYDVAIERRWLDPMRPVAELVLKPAHGVLVTSATLRDGAQGEDWGPAMARSGAAQLGAPPLTHASDSPFDYARQASVLIVTDVERGNIAALAAAYARLIAAAGGGALGLFTAIRRLRGVHARIADRLARDGLPLFAQHVDPIDTGTLIEIFRDDPRASLIGTDALRDGIDVPGHSLRLVILESVPWPRPDLLHRARRAAGGGAAYDDQIIRARLAQAFGRLIRRSEDRGHFVLLSPAMPSRLLSAFPPATPVRRVTLDEAVAAVTAGLSPLDDLGHGVLATSDSGEGETP